MAPSDDDDDIPTYAAAVPTVALPPPAVVAHPPFSSARRVPPPCWSAEETLALIDSYQQKWYSLSRGNLKASHWEDVAEAVHARCRSLPGSAPKTAVQCRHKVEKLRKRYRSEKQRLLRANPKPRSPPPSSSWAFFRKMEAMEVGSSPAKPAAAASAAAAAATATARDVPRRSSPSPSPSEDESSDDVSDGEEEGSCRQVTTDRGGNFRSVHGLLSNGTGGLRLNIPKAVRSKSGVPRNEGPSSNPPGRSNGTTGGYRAADHTTRFEGGFPRVKTHEGSVMEVRRRVVKKRHREQEVHPSAVTTTTAGGLGEIVAAVRVLGDEFMRMEQMKMDMKKEIHDLRMEMELKHSEMIHDTHRRVVDAFVTGITGRKRANVSTKS